MVLIDVKTAFSQTGPAERRVYVLPSKKFGHRNVLWLLLAATYRLVNANTKCQGKSDRASKDLGLLPSPLLPQLFVKSNNNQTVVMLAIKIVDDILLTGHDDALRDFINAFNDIYELGEIAQGPGVLIFFGLNLVQDSDFSVTIDAENKLKSIVPYAIKRNRRHQLDKKMNGIELKAFRSLNASLGWLGITSSPLRYL